MEEDHTTRSWKVVTVFFLIQLTILILYAECTEYSSLTTGAVGNSTQGAAAAQVEQYYPFFQHVHVMVFIGFGFLMTFLKKYSFSAVGFNFLISAVCLQWGILSNGFWHSAFKGHWEKIVLDIETLITGDFAAAAVMITFGAVLGKVSPLQMLLLGMLEIIFYSINESIGVIEYQAVDMGGSIFVHMFGGFYGVAASYILTRKSDLDRAQRLIGSTRTTDTFAMIGTIFLWMYWPSFNGALAQGTSRQRVVVNTVLALCGSCSTAFFVSYLLRGDGRFNMVDVQNATLAGGVAVGSSSDLVVDSWVALLIGCLAGAVSVFGYTKMQPALERWGVHDTCGVINLHGIPGLMGAIGGIISARVADDEVYGEDISTVFAARANGSRSAEDQALYQMAATFTCLGISVGSGLLCGWIVRSLGDALSPPHSQAFDDDRYWQVEEEEEMEQRESPPAPLPAGPALAPARIGTEGVKGLDDLWRLTPAQFDELREAIFAARPATP